MSGRLGGRKRQAVNQSTTITRLHQWTMPSMADAIRKSSRPIWKNTSKEDKVKDFVIGQFAQSGNPVRLQNSMKSADVMVEEAIRIDQRLARKALWLRRDEGEHVDAGLLAEGDDQPFFKRSRTVESDATRSGEPVRVIISTDSRQVRPDTAAAFIATARIVQQFMPLEIWWQGSWLTADTYRGYVFLVPLVKEDADFSRLEFCIADPFRDTFSFRVMAAYSTYDAKEDWMGCGTEAHRSFHPDRKAHFVSHTGIDPTPERVAQYAAAWLGLDPQWYVESTQREAANGAEQSLPPLPTAPYVCPDPTAEDKARWKREERERELQRQLEAAERLASV